MTQYNSLNDSLNKLNSAIRNGTDVKSLRKAFNNHTSANIKFSKAQLTKMQKGGFLRFVAPLLKSGLPLLKSVIKPLGMLGLPAAASATDAAISKKIFGSGNHITLISSNNDM